MRILLLLLLFLSFLPFKGRSQSFGVTHDPSVPVRDSSGNTLKNPWAGGLNFCQFSRIDVDLDGKEDLLAFDRSGDKLEVFLYREDQGNPEWVHSEEYDDRFPQLTNWVLCRDFNDDGRKDLFTSTSGGIALYKNSPVNGELSFEPVSDQLLSDHYPDDNSTGPINIYVQSADIPVVDDIDGDGDLDLLNFHILGTQVEYHKNMALEETGNTDTVIFERGNACWGFFSEGGSSNTVNLDDSCSGNVQNPEWGKSPEQERSVQRHSGSTMLTLDMNGDGVKELILGDIDQPELVLLNNDGGPYSSHIGSEERPFPQNDVPVDLEVFPGSFHLDVDHDGVRDLLVSPNKGTVSENRKSIWFYKNQGNDSVPDFELQEKDFLQKDMIDLGEGAFPVLHDIDGDGDQDLFIGNQYLRNANGDQGSSIAFLENVGSSSSPEFRLRTRDYEDLSQAGMGKALYPAFADLDDDGDADLLIGDSDGYLHYFENTASPGDPPSYVLMEPQYEDDQGDPIDVGQFATPALVDIDRDGMKDLVIGCKGGNLVHYENKGSPSSPSFAHRTDSLGDVLVKDSNDFEGYSVPAFYEMNGAYELIVGSKSGRLHYYNDIEGNLNGAFNLVSGHFSFVDAGLRSAPAVSDLNGDGEPDMILGNYGGGVAHLKGGDPNVAVQDKDREEEFSIYPNPVNSKGVLWITSDERIPYAPSQLRLFNSQGQEIPLDGVQRADETRLRIQMPPLASGLYFLQPSPSSAAHELLVE